MAQTVHPNPDLYFLISDKNKEKFKLTAIASENEYLKYLSNEDYDNPEVVKRISHRFNYFNESLACVSTDNFKKLLNGAESKYVVDSLLSLTVAQCQYLKEPLKLYLEENKQQKGLNWFNDILNKNPYLYTILDKNKYQDENSKKLLISLAGKYHNLFPYLPEEWKTDLEIISKVITDNTTLSFNFLRYGNKYHEMVKDVALVLNEYKSPEQFIQEKIYANEAMIHLRAAYPKLNLEWRKQELIIKNLFKERDNFEIDLDYCRSIPDEELAKKLVEQLKNFKSRTLNDIGSNLEAVLTHHYLSEKLEDKKGNEKKPKI